MNDCLVTNQLADRIGRNVISALLGKELYEASGSPYLVRHLLLDGACLLLLSAAAYPLMVIKKWKKKKRTGRLAVVDAARRTAISSRLEESMDILNKTICKRILSRKKPADKGI